jgi:hypothetical protein
LPDGIANAVQGIFLTNLFPAIRWRFWGAVTALAVAAVVAGWFGYTKMLARKAKQETLTRRFVGAIGTSRNAEPSADELAALWQLAQLGKEDQIVRRQVLQLWAGSPELLVRAFANRARGWHAAVGLNSTLVADFNTCAAEVAKHLATALENRQEIDANAFRAWPRWRPWPHG